MPVDRSWGCLWGGQGTGPGVEAKREGAQFCLHGCFSWHYCVILSNGHNVYRKATGEKLLSMPVVTEVIHVTQANCVTEGLGNIGLILTDT